MSKSEKLNSLFSKQLVRNFAPIANILITLLKSRKIVITRFVKELNRYIQKENKQYIYVDRQPCWNCTFDKLLSNVKNICCKYYTPQNGDIVIDVGAGVGTEVIVFNKFVGDKGRIFAIEPHPQTALSLLRLVDLNRCKNISIHQIAIDSKTDFACIEDRDLHVANSIIEKGQNCYKIKTMTLDDFIKEQSINRIDFLKVNIEGAEERMIEGMKETIKITQHIAVSCHDFIENNLTNRIKSKVAVFLEQNHFNIYFSDDQNIVRRSWVYADKKKF